MDVPPARCPKCNAYCDAVTPMEIHVLPSDGDISICLYCLSVNVFHNGDLKIATQEDIADYPKDELEAHIREVARIRQIVLEIKRRNLNATLPPELA